MTLEEARLVRCPNCGGDVTSGARRCSYCRSELATVRCHHCYAMSAASAVHCAGCGRELGLEPVGTNAELACPACREVLASFAGNGGSLLDCGACGGQFVEHALLSSLLEEREVRGRAVPRRTARAKLDPAPVRYLPCPACTALMNRKNFGGDSGVVVDVCPKHGTWFDEGELPRVLAFVESGGLVRAHAREAERRAEEQRAARVRALAATPAGVSGATGEATGLAEGVIDLLVFVGDLLVP